MKYKIGDKVIFLKRSSKIDAWPLNNYEEYEIVNRAFDNSGTNVFYGVEDRKGQGSTWYLEEDFLSLIEARKIKLDKIKCTML